MKTNDMSKKSNLAEGKALNSDQIPFEPTQSNGNASRDKLADADLDDVSGGIGGRAGPDFTWDQWAKNKS